MKQNVNYKLYLVTDRYLLQNVDLLKAVEEAILGGVTIIQLREKSLSSLEFYNSALDLKKVTDKYNVPLIINDRLDIAIAIDASGLHLGQKDLPPQIARKILGENKILGVSAATVEEAKAAVRDGADYIGVGAMFQTYTKQDTRAVSVELLKEIKNSVPVPIVAIGGISEKNAALLQPAQIDGIAVVSAILGKSNIRQAAQEIRSVI